MKSEKENNEDERLATYFASMRIMMKDKGKINENYCGFPTKNYLIKSMIKDSKLYVELWNLEDKKKYSNNYT
jgi:hypothetical protein